MTDKISVFLKCTYTGTRETIPKFHAQLCTLILQSIQTEGKQLRDIAEKHVTGIQLRTGYVHFVGYV